MKDYDELLFNIDPILKLNQMKLMTPELSNTLHRCTLEREKNFLNGSTFRLSDSANGEFMMCAKKVKTAFTSYYHISMVENTFEKQNGYIGKLRSNF